MFKFSQKYNKRIVAILLTLFCLNSPLSQADTARRQNVIERTQGYSEGIDLIQIRQDTIRSFKADAGKNKVFNVDNVKVVSDGCGGYTQSSCGTPCCGQEECKNICSTNLSVGSHGSKYTCLETEQTSPCGMSCCGKLDCDNVCLNYRFDPCGGKNFTSKGYKCCGETDCANAECDYFTVTDSSEGGKAGIPCCGWWDCHNKACDNQVFVNSKVDSETGIPCCGAEDCHKVECGGKTKVDSLVYPDRTNLDCCGEENCHLIACDNYIETNTPTGIQACCGYDDCNYKRCEGKFSTTLPNGTVQACCGSAECSNIFAQFAAKFVATTSSARCKQGCHEDYYLYCDAHSADHQCGRWTTIPTCVQEPYDRNYRYGTTMNGYGDGSPGTCGDPRSGSISTTITPIYGGVSYTFTKVSYLSNGSWQSQNVNASGSVTISSENPTNITVDVSINGKMYYGVGVQQ